LVSNLKHKRATPNFPSRVSCLFIRQNKDTNYFSIIQIIC